MSSASMELEFDVPRQVFPYTSAPTANGHHVQFDTDVKVVQVPSTASQQQSRPKHKARRRARVPNLQLEDGETSAVSSTAKPPSPSKLKKMADKDRHSRTGRRGQPKKGECRAPSCPIKVVIVYYCVCAYVLCTCKRARGACD